MADTLDALASHLSSQRGEQARIVVWAHNSHVGDSRATERGSIDEITLGQVIRERHPEPRTGGGDRRYAGSRASGTDGALGSRRGARDVSQRGVIMRASQSRDIAIEVGQAAIAGSLTVPDGAVGIVIFAHGSGSSRHSPRNRAVAAQLNAAALSTLLLDLLTPGEDALDRRTAELRFDIPLLTERVRAAVDWAAGQAEIAALPIGLFGASTGGAAALAAAADSPAVRAIVLRGGRPDLAGQALERVGAPTLMIVGGEDTVVLVLNRQACARMTGECSVHVIPGATHLFEESGALEEVSRLASDWFTRYLRVRT